jgi:hypothetical protein
MVPTSFVVRAKAADGNPIVLLLYPHSDSEWQVSPLDGDDDHSTIAHPTRAYPEL